MTSPCSPVRLRPGFPYNAPLLTSLVGRLQAFPPLAVRRCWERSSAMPAWGASRDRAPRPVHEHVAVCALSFVVDGDSRFLHFYALVRDGFKCLPTANFDSCTLVDGFPQQSPDGSQEIDPACCAYVRQRNSDGVLA